MDLKAIAAALVRRWYFVLLVLACSVGATLFVADKVGPNYEAQGAVLVFPPVATVQRGAETVTQGNPYLALDGVSQARDIVIRELTSKKTADEFDLLFPGTTFEATPDVMNNAPIILITVESPDEGTAVDGVSNLMARVPTSLTQLQEGLGLDSNSLITSRPLIADERPEAVYKDQIRAAVVAAVVTLALGLLAIGLLDGLMTSRRKKSRPVKHAEGPDADRVPDSQADQTLEISDRSSPAGVRQSASAQPGRPAGVASTRMRPRSPATNLAAGPTNGAARGHASESASKNGSHSLADPAQRR